MEAPIDVTTNDSEVREWAEPAKNWFEDTRARPQSDFHNVRIKAPDMTGAGAEIWLDDVKLRGVRRYVVAVGLSEATEVTVTFLANSVNRDEPEEVKDQA